MTRNSSSSSRRGGMSAPYAGVIREEVVEEEDVGAVAILVHRHVECAECVVMIVATWTSTRCW